MTSAGTGEGQDYNSGDPLFVLDEQLRVVSWNAGIAELTGVATETAIGKPCWSILGGVADDGAAVCHAACRLARNAFQCRSPSSGSLLVRTASGRRRVIVSTIAARVAGKRRLVHLMRAAPAAPSSSPAAEDVAELTPREREVLELLSAGEGPKEIAAGLGITVSTVRTHIRHILRKLGVHTQLAAVVRASSIGG